MSEAIDRDAAARADARGNGRARNRIVVGLASLVCGLGIAASTVTLVRAADDAGVIDFFRFPALSRLIDPYRLRPRYDEDSRLIYRPQAEAKRREARRHDAWAARVHGTGARIVDGRIVRGSASASRERAVARSARLALAAASKSTSSQTLCVRTCDGYAFPIGTLRSRSELPTHQTACGAACPGTETKLYTLAAGQSLEDPSRARSVSDGTRYASLSTALLHRSKAVESCGCRTAQGLTSRLPLLLDPTLRRGDVIVDDKGLAKAFAGSDRLPRPSRAFTDYERSPALSRQAKAQVDRAVGTTVRRRIADAYAQRQRERLASATEDNARAPLIRPASFGPIREFAPPAGSASGVRAFSYTQSGSVRHASGATIITVQ